MKPKIGLVTLGVADLARSVAFYRDGLGFPAENYDPDAGVAFFRLEGAWLSLFPREELAKDAGIDPVGSGFSGITLAHNEPSKEGVDAAFAEALAAGARPVKPPEDVFWGGYSGYFADPDGHLWEVAYNPFTDLT
ncbi:VOC family protein [Altericroceibacterium xinjiangense]|uniref:VOC family protein n=1 Tax=Altericroceibacterium xinjiangense TaxID=762261 RepID=UPI000F7FA14A|nr:VOC family protein [Altericroceibacterium xinjiangense]